MSHIAAPLRRLVHLRAAGACEYCLLPESMGFAAFEVDHVIAQKHGGATEPDNLALSCPLCNQHKGTDLASVDPETGALTPLFHPRRERWEHHFCLTPEGVVPLTAVARATVRLLQLNRPARVAERALLIAAGLLRTEERGAR